MSNFELSPRDWTDFYEKMNRVERRLADKSKPDSDDAGKPGCNDDEVAPVDGVDARTIVSRFWSTESVQTLRRYVDPLNWPQLSRYWKVMQPHGKRTDVADGYDAVFREVVALPTGEITAFLAVSHRYTDDYVMTRYCETTTPYNEDVRIDRGWVLATRQTVSPPDFSNRSTLVEATKTIEFRDELLNEFTGLACDNGWVDLMIGMVRATAAKEFSGPTMGPDPFPATDPLEQLRRTAHTTVDRHVGVTKRILAAMRHGSLDRGLEDDLYELVDQYVDLTAEGAKVSRGLLDDLGKGRDKP